MPDPRSTPQLLQVKKYPNRRLYDRTRSCHLTHEELYDLVVAGHTVCVTDSRTGADITNLVLMQALIERGPEKFAAIPPEVVHLMIRASEQMLRSMATGWFAQMMKGVGPIGTPPASGFSWPSTTGFPWTAPGASERTSGQRATTQEPDPVADLQSRMEAMLREIAALKSGRETKP